MSVEEEARQQQQKTAGRTMRMEWPSECCAKTKCVLCSTIDDWPGSQNKRKEVRDIQQAKQKTIQLPHEKVGKKAKEECATHELRMLEEFELVDIGVIVV